MKLFHIASSSIVLTAMLVAGGCYTPQPTTLYGSEDLPKQDWYTLGDGSSEVKTLPPALQNALADQRLAVNNEMAAKGAISPDTRKRITDLNDACNSAYLVSFDLIATNPTPGLNGYAETWDSRRRDDSMVFNQNFRAMADEWSRFWLMDAPGPTPYNTINTTGRQ
ncbi:MAG: hypothetical protein JNK53_08330 [Phycisphaerae bacterium]|nr:hypothetical protein [Phycisphaerae bacterium]